MSIKSINWLKIWPHVLAIVGIVIINFIYFFPQLEGKVLQQSDIVSSGQAGVAISEYQKANDKIYLWNPSQFAGMPRLSGPPTFNNYIYHGYTVLRLGLSEPLGLFIAGAIMSYLLLIFLGCGPLISFILSITMLISTSNVMLWEAGHNSKIRTLIFTPFLVAGVLSIFERRKYLLGFLSLALGFALSFYTRHPQMTYYILIIFIVYGIKVLVEVWQKKDWVHLAKGTSLVAAALIIGMATSATTVWSLYDYKKSTMRGDAILESKQGVNDSSSSTVDGLSWEYANQWSNDYKDLIAMYIPGFVGGGGAQKVSTKSASFKKYRIKEAPLYWGQLPFTVGPMYMGASLIFLFVLGLFWVQGNVKWWLGIGGLLMMLLSMGDNFSILNRLLFDYFPFYSSFRAPQSILNVAPFFIPILPALVLQKLSKVRKSKKTKKILPPKLNIKQLYIAYGLCGGLALIIALIGPSIYDFVGAGDSRYQQMGYDTNDFVLDRMSLMRSDAMRTFIIVSIIAGLIFGYLKSKLTKNVMLGIIGVVVLFDVVGVSLRYLSHDDFVTKNQLNEVFQTREVDKQILAAESKRELYRVHDLTINSFNSSQSSAFFNTIGGYDPAKLQRFEDVRNYHIAKNNMQVLNMLNTKYFITPGEDNKPQVQMNGQALGNAWFVDEVNVVASPEEEINALDNINTAKQAVVLGEEFPGYVDGLVNADNAASRISLTAYEPDRITYSSNANSKAMAVFSEIWYGPNKGWQAYIDGEEVPHIRVNYLLRGLSVPSGTHEIVFEFKPKTYYTGEKISLAASLFLIILTFVSFGKEAKNVL